MTRVAGPRSGKTARSNVRYMTGLEFADPIDPDTRSKYSAAYLYMK